MAYREILPVENLGKFVGETTTAITESLDQNFRWIIDKIAEKSTG